MRFSFISAAPEAFSSYLETSIIGRALKEERIAVDIVDLRTFGEGKHKVIDDSPFGGGPGMVLKIEPIVKAVASVKTETSRVVLFSTRGTTFTQKEAQRLSEYDHIVAICGRYEGIDQRVVDALADEEISMGPYVLTGGELPGLILLDSVTRLIPGVLGTHSSLEDIKGSYPTYTRPASFSLDGETYEVPEVLLSGDHEKIAAWRKESDV
mgnify:CR=1 FL=1